MKIYITILITLLFSFSGFASIDYSKVDDVYCTGPHPLILGDVCLINLTLSTGRKLSIVTDMDDFFNTYDEGDLDNQVLEVDISKLSMFTNYQAVRILREISPEYYYMQGTTDSFSIKTSKSEIKKMLSKMNGSLSLAKIPSNYKVTKLTEFPLNDNAKFFLTELTIKKKIAWKNFVLESGEYDARPLVEIKEIINNPWKELQVSKLLEVQKMYKIEKDGVIIGYFLSIDDHVRASIIQDGAWIEVYFGVNQNLVKMTNQSA